MTLTKCSVFQSAMRQTLAYGVLPSEEAFMQAFADDLGEDSIYRIRNCRELDAVYGGGNVDFDCDGLWKFLCDCVEAGPNNQEGYDLASDILYTLGFEWL